MLNNTKKNILAWIAILGAIALFLFSCFVASVDGQGAILFIFTFPALFLLLLLAITLTKQGQEGSEVIWKKNARWVAKGTLAFTLAFLICAFIPGLKLFTHAVMKGFSIAFESVTGKSPYVWVRERNQATH